jgi:hypothetical protein
VQLSKDKVFIRNYRFFHHVAIFTLCAVFMFSKLKIFLKEHNFKFHEASHSNVTTVLKRCSEKGILCRDAEVDFMYSQKESALKLTTNVKLFFSPQNQSGYLTVRFF